MKIDWTLFGLLLLDFLVFSTFSLPLPFFPKVAKDKGVGEGVIGFIFGSFDLGAVISSLIYGKIMFFFGKKQMLYVNMIFCTLGTISFGILNLIDDLYLFQVIACLSRLISGFMSGGIVTIIFGFLPTLYPDELPQKQAYFEIAFSFATIGGSLLGGLLSKFVGFQLPFIIVGASYLLIGLPIIYKLPDIEQIQDQQQLQREQIQQNLIQQSQQRNSALPIPPQNDDLKKSLLTSSRKDKKKLKFRTFLMNPRFFFTTMFVMIQIATSSFAYSTLQLRMDTFENGEDYVLPAFMISGSIYGIFCIGFSKVLPKHIDQRYYIAIGTFIMTMSLIPAAPIESFNVPKNIPLFFFGLIAQYIGMGLGLFAILNELCLIGLNIDSKQDNNQVTDMCSGIFVSAVSIGGFLGPFLGGLLVQWLDFDRGFLICWIYCMVIFILYMTFGKGWELFFGINSVHQDIQSEDALKVSLQNNQQYDSYENENDNIGLDIDVRIDDNENNNNNNDNDNDNAFNQYSKLVESTNNEIQSNANSQ